MKVIFATGEPKKIKEYQLDDKTPLPVAGDAVAIFDTVEEGTSSSELWFVRSRQFTYDGDEPIVVIHVFQPEADENEEPDKELPQPMTIDEFLDS